MWLTLLLHIHHPEPTAKCAEAIVDYMDALSSGSAP
jgi:hypothetical protein